MANCFDLIVHYARRKRVFRIEPTMSLRQILCLIANNFRLKSNEFLLEIVDTRFDLLIALDNSYFDELRSHPYFAGKRSLSAQIRPRRSSASKMKLDADYLTTSMLCETRAIQDHLIVWLDPYVAHVEDYVSLKSYFNCITAVDGTGMLSIDTDGKIYNLIMTSYGFEFDECYYKNSIMNILKTFSDSQECLEFIQNATARGKKIFFISSSSLIQEMTPDIFDQEHVFSIYILFDGMSDLEQWIDYCINISQVLFFTHELDLLYRITRDIAVYYERKSLNDVNSEDKLAYLRWARKLYVNATVDDNQTIPLETLQYFEKRIEEVENDLKIDYANDHNVPYGVECDEIFKDCLKFRNY